MCGDDRSGSGPRARRTTDDHRSCCTRQVGPRVRCEARLQGARGLAVIVGHYSGTGALDFSGGKLLDNLLESIPPARCRCDIATVQSCKGAAPVARKHCAVRGEAGVPRNSTHRLTNATLASWCPTLACTTWDRLDARGKFLTVKLRSYSRSARAFAVRRLLKPTTRWTRPPPPPSRTGGILGV